MVEILENIAGQTDSKSELGERKYSPVSKDAGGYSTFAEMYFEKPVEVRAGITPTICTWRGVPTVDDF